jgi:hypothetical protein
MGWASKRNGELLALAAGLFDVFITADRNLSYQQDLSSFDIVIVVLVARSNRFDDLRPSRSGSRFHAATTTRQSWVHPR